MAAAGRIITFYSYKGGTGRSMAVANVAWILASHGQKVLMIDWDLEAPGLTRYFHPFVDRVELEESPGVIDFVMECTTDAVNRLRRSDGERDPELAERINILRYVLPIDWRFGDDPDTAGKLHLITAGRQGPSYGTRVNTFDWQAFYARRNGRAYLDVARKQMRDAYDYILVDSRTGVSDTSGICTVHMPDTLAVFFTLNAQSIEGVARTVASVQRQWESDPRYKDDSKRIYPFITRIEYTELDKLEVARDYVRVKFDPLLDSQDIDDLESYWARAETPYISYYAFEEVLAVFKDRPRDTASILAACERIAGCITNGEIAYLSPPSPADKQRVLVQFKRTAEDVAEAAEGEVPVRPAPPAPLRRALRRTLAYRLTLSMPVLLALITGLWVFGAAWTLFVSSQQEALYNLGREKLEAKISAFETLMAVREAEMAARIKAEVRARSDAELKARLAAELAEKQGAELETKIEVLEKQTNLTEQQKILLAKLQERIEADRKAAEKAREELALAAEDVKRLRQELDRIRQRRQLKK